jgi:phage shock protein PspC (stress-responsive transcriptional regulator)
MTMANGQRNNTLRAVLVGIGCLLVAVGLYHLLHHLMMPWWPEVSRISNLVIVISWPLAVLLAVLFVVHGMRRGIIVPPAGRKLCRKREGRVLGGVCAGIAECFGTSAGLVRLIAILLLFSTFFIFGVVYVALWVGLPEEPQVPSEWM